MFSDATIAAVIVLSVVIIVLLARPPREGFASARAHEVYQASRALFDKTGGKASYSEYKTLMEKNADPVVYTDTRNLWKKGSLSPESVERVL